MQLYDPARHETLTQEPWDEDRAQAIIDGIVEDARSTFDVDALWPVHPREDVRVTGKSLYCGAAGVGSALRLIAGDAGTLRDLDWVDFFELVWRRHLDEPETGAAMPSWWLGGSGILTALFREDRSAEGAHQQLLELIDSNIDNPTMETLWGSPGTMQAALFMHEWTGERRWADCFRRCADQLWRQWEYDEDAGCWLWTQDLYGHVRRFVGAGHGQAGNLYPLWRGYSLLTEERRQTLLERTVELIDTLAISDGVYANWPGTIDDEPRIPAAQWCHGAPGILIALTFVPTTASSLLEEYLQRAGELTWKAGPVTKGCGLCHGTAGNGFALLKCFARTEDRIWLERARRFAMHAIGQYEDQQDTFRRGWYSLWTGDLGLASFLSACIREDASIPGLDIL